MTEDGVDPRILALVQELVRDNPGEAAKLAQRLQYLHYSTRVICAVLTLAADVMATISGRRGSVVRVADAATADVVHRRCVELRKQLSAPEPGEATP